ncbi:MAG: pyrroline-5-carboxylate reductase family protein [Anaeromassilibacillus sp.]
MVIVMIAAGQTIAVNEARFARNIKIVRAMPNTPALVGEGMAARCANSSVTDEEKDEVREIFESFGKAEFVAENMMDVVAGVSGSSPAYVYMFIEALADGAVLQGMPRQQAYTFAAQAVLAHAWLDRHAPRGVKIWSARPAAPRLRRSPAGAGRPARRRHPRG